MIFFSQLTLYDMSKYILDYRKKQTGTFRISENRSLQTVTS